MYLLLMALYFIKIDCQTMKGNIDPSILEVKKFAQNDL